MTEPCRAGGSSWRGSSGRERRSSAASGSTHSTSADDGRTAPGAGPRPPRGPPTPALEAGVDAAVSEILVAAEARAVVPTG